MSSRNPAIHVLTAAVALTVGCTFEASGEARTSGQASTGSGGEVAEAEPRAERQRRVRHERERPGRRVRRRPRHRAVPPPKGPPRDTVFGSTKPNKRALQGNIYFLPENTPRLPDFDELEPEGTVYAKKIDVPERRFEEGFPGISERFEWFGIVYSGSFRVRKAGSYQFRIVSDDGAKLWIDGELVVDNDGQHPPQSKSGTVELDRGEHDIVLEYFQGPRHHIALQLFVTEPGGEEEIFKVK
ncbi:MAG: PA14 domain-containing protein [Myxococcota bacterium]